MQSPTALMRLSFHTYKFQFVEVTHGQTNYNLIHADHYPDIRYGIKFSKNNIGHEGRIYTFPYFCAFLLKRFMAGFHAEEEAE